MDDLRRWFEQGIAAHLLALESARRALDLGLIPARASVRRLAASLVAGGSGGGSQEITHAARALLDGTDGQLREHLDHFLGAIRATVLGTDAEPVEVLIVDANPASHRYLESTLTMPNRVFHVADSVEAAERRLAARVPALVLLDLHLPDQDGRALLMSIRSRDELAAVPVIVLAGEAGPQERTECFALGADEVIGKPFDPVSLATCVAAKLRRAAELTRWSQVDALTGLPNRSALEHAYARVREATSSMSMPFSIAVIDVGCFKLINELCGRATGTEILRAAAAAMGGSLPSWDLVGHWGGGRFVVLFPNDRKGAARQAVERSLAAFTHRQVRSRDGKLVRVLFSAAVVEVGVTTRLAAALERAERQLSVAKAGDRDTVVEVHGAREEERRALIVEDDTVTAMVLDRMLQQGGYAVDRESDGGAALRLASRRASSLVLLDVKLPTVDGFEVLQRVRELPAYAQTPVVMVSAVADSREIARGLHLGADDYVVKPFSPVELMARIDRLDRHARTGAV